MSKRRSASRSARRILIGIHELRLILVRDHPSERVSLTEAEGSQALKGPLRGSIGVHKHVHLRTLFVISGVRAVAQISMSEGLYGISIGRGQEDLKRPNDFVQRVAKRAGENNPEMGKGFPVGTVQAPRGYSRKPLPKSNLTCVVSIDYGIVCC